MTKRCFAGRGGPRRDPTPHLETYTRTYTVERFVQKSTTWCWEHLRALPQSVYAGDVHGATTSPKLGMTFTGVSVDTLLAASRPFADAPMCWPVATTKPNRSAPTARSRQSWSTRPAVDDIVPVRSDARVPADGEIVEGSALSGPPILLHGGLTRDTDGSWLGELAAGLSDRELRAQLRLPAWRSERGTATLRTEFRRRLARRNRRDLDWQELVNVDPGGPGRRSVILRGWQGVARAGGPSAASRGGRTLYLTVSDIETAGEELIARRVEVAGWICGERVGSVERSEG